MTLNNMMLGRYIPGNSVMHRLDPRAKLLASVLFFFIVFAANSPIDYALLTLFMVRLIKWSDLKIAFLWQSLLPMKWLILFTAFFQILFVQTGDVLFQWWIFSLTTGGLMSSFYITLRFMLIIDASALLSLTTNPLMIADSVESMLAPFNRFGMPSHEIALILSIAMRFVPTILDEAQTIMNAQRSRGVDFNEGSLLRRTKAMIPILVPLFAGALRRAEELANAMEARGYRGGEGRTKYRRMQWTWLDTSIFGVLAIVFVVILIV